MKKIVIDGHVILLTFDVMVYGIVITVSMNLTVRIWFAYRMNIYCQLADASGFRCLSIEYLFDKYLNDCPQDDDPIIRQIFFNNRTNNNMSEYISWNKTNCITQGMICRRHSLILHSDDEICYYQRSVSLFYFRRTYILSTNR